MNITIANNTQLTRSLILDGAGATVRSGWIAAHSVTTISHDFTGASGKYRVTAGSQKALRKPSPQAVFEVTSERADSSRQLNLP